MSKRMINGEEFMEALSIQYDCKAPKEQEALISILTLGVMVLFDIAKALDSATVYKDKQEK